MTSSKNLIKGIVDVVVLGIALQVGADIITKILTMYDKRVKEIRKLGFTKIEAKSILASNTDKKIEKVLGV